MITSIRTDSDNKDFQKLVQELDADLRIRDGEEHSFFAQFNKIDSIRNVIVAYDNNVPVGCGAIKHYAEDTVEVKRMYVLPEHRGRGIASFVLAALESWAAELNYKKCILETGEKQPEAIALYHKNQYSVIPNFGQYADVPTSVCFEKLL
jgi:GNAT superfamily N-acetyltransferase